MPWEWSRRAWTAALTVKNDFVVYQKGFQHREHERERGVLRHRKKGGARATEKGRRDHKVQRLKRDNQEGKRKLRRSALKWT